MTQGPMTTTRKYLFGGSVLALAIAAVLLARPGAAADTLRIFDWSDPGAAYRKDGPAQSGLTFILTNDTYYTPLAAGAAPARGDGLPIAILSAPPQGTTDVAIHETPAMQSAPSNAFLYLRASVRYRFAGQETYLTTAQPLPIGKEQPLSIGRLYGTVDGGRALYVTSEVLRQGMNREIVRTFNQVSFVENGLVVTLASELPQDELVALLKTVTFNER